MVQFFTTTTRAVTCSAYTEIFHCKDRFSQYFVDLAPLQEVLIQAWREFKTRLEPTHEGGYQEAVRKWQLGK